MPDCMSFPDNIMDFIDDYSFEDSDHVYTNGSKLIQSFRVKQAVEHYLLREQEPVKPELQIIRCKDCKFNSGRCNGLYIQFVTCYKTGSLHKEDWFCADGERR